MFRGYLPRLPSVLPASRLALREECGFDNTFDAVCATRFEVRMPFLDILLLLYFRQQSPFVHSQRFPARAKARIFVVSVKGSGLEWLVSPYEDVLT